MPSPEFLYFDLGNVLLTYDHRQACRQMAELAGIAPQRVWELVFESDLQRQYERGALSCQRFYEEFCRLSGTRPPFSALRDAASDIFAPNEPMLEVVAQLQQAGRRLGIFSNTCAAHWELISIRRFPALRSLFDVFALSYQLKALKPEPESYQAAAALAETPAERIFFVDDRAENVHGARACGWDSVPFTDPPRFLAELQQRRVLSA